MPAGIETEIVTDIFAALLAGALPSNVAATLSAIGDVKVEDAAVHEPVIKSETVAAV